jgi:PPOX class probable F420-dependent enzyme
VGSLILTEKALKLISGRNLAHIATISRDGMPQLSQVWVDHEGNTYILINTAEGRAKVRNLRRDPRVVISVVDSANPYNTVTIRGRATEITHSGAEEHIDKMAKKYQGKNKFKKSSPAEVRVLIKVLPEKIIGW